MDDRARGVEVGTMSSEQVPKEAKLISLLLTSAGVPECEPKVIPQLIEFMFRYSTDVLQDAIVFAEHAGKSEVELDDIRLAVQSQTANTFAGPPPRDILMELAARKNTHPLPAFEAQKGFRLPPDNQCLLAANYKITTMRNVPMQRPAGPDDPSKRLRQM